MEFISNQLSKSEEFSIKSTVGGEVIEIDETFVELFVVAAYEDADETADEVIEAEKTSVELAVPAERVGEFIVDPPIEAKQFMIILLKNESKNLLSIHLLKLLLIILPWNDSTRRLMRL